MDPGNGRWEQDLERLLESWPGRDPADVVKDICDLGVAMGDAAGDDLLDSDPRLLDCAPLLTQAHYRHVLRKDANETARLLAQTWNGPVTFADVASPLALHSYQRVGDMFEHVDFSNCERLVMVGCGALPVTLLHAHDRTKVREIVGLDVRSDAVETASKLAARLGYSRVRTEWCDGLTYDYGGAQIVFVANMVSPKSAVLSRVVDTAPDFVQIVVREPYSLGRLLAEKAESDLDPRLEITGRGRGWTGNLSRDVYMRPRKGRGLARGRA